MGYKSSLGKFKEIEIISSILPDHNAMRLDINYRKKSVRNTNTWRLNNTLLNNQENTEEIKEEIRKYLETNDNENTKTQNLWDAAKGVLRGKFIAIQAYLKKQATSQTNNLNLHLKQLEKEEQKNPKVSRRKQIIKIRSEINEKEMIAKINKTDSWFSEKINKIDKPLARLIKKKREKTQINKIRNEKGEVTTDTAEIQTIMRDYYKQLYVNKMNNLEEMDKLLEMHNLQRLNQEEIENMNRPITSTEIKL